MNCEIICVGTELLLGDVLNTDSKYLSNQLADIGINVFYQVTVGDNSERLEEALRTALSRSDLIITTGGLGPTEDDITKEVCAKVAGRSLKMNEKILTNIMEFFDRTGKTMADSNKKQAMIPEGAIIFENTVGTAPGCMYTTDDKTIINLPGPYKELKKMMESSVLDELKKMSTGAIVSHTIHVFGIGEALASEKAEELLKGKNPSAAPYSRDGEMLFRVTASADSKDKAEELCRPAIVEFFNIFGSYVYGMDCGNLEQRVVTLLRKRKLKAAVAESCTGGILSSRLTDIPGASSIFEYGITAYSNEMKTKHLDIDSETLSKYGAVSPQVAVQMAMGARSQSGSDLGVGITGVAGPSSSQRKPVGLIYVAICDKKDVWSIKLQGKKDEGCRDYNRMMASSSALNLMRLYLEDRIDFAKEELSILKGVDFSGK